MYPTTMKALFPVLGLSISLPFASYAQSTGDTLTSRSFQLCLLESGPDVWASLVLTTDQLERMKRVQEACKEECAASNAEQQGNIISNADGSTVLGEVRNILTAEQFDRWQRDCVAHRPALEPER